jgi:hypothetical protein
MSTQITPRGFRALGLALIARLEQQNRDRQECRNGAASQTDSSRDGEGNLRAQAACLEGRGYSVK